MKVVADESWPINDIPKEEALKILHEKYPKEPIPIWEHLFDWYCEETQESSEEGLYNLFCFHYMCVADS